MLLSLLLFRQNNVDLNYMKRVGLMMLTLRDGLEMPASLGSLTIHFRHMTENVYERERERRRESARETVWAGQNRVKFRVSRHMSFCHHAGYRSIAVGLTDVMVRAAGKILLLTIEAAN